jgi:hypothetical protein
MRFMFIVGACCTFFKWTVLPKVSFNSTVPTSRIEAAYPFPIRMEEDWALGKKRTKCVD